VGNRLADRARKYPGRDDPAELRRRLHEQRITRSTPPLTRPVALHGFAHNPFHYLRLLRKLKALVLSFTTVKTASESKVNCPHCDSWETLPSQRSNVVERALRRVITPWRCYVCSKRFYLFSWMEPKPHSPTVSD
jgi:hypothetical protein